MESMDIDKDVLKPIIKNMDIKSDIKDSTSIKTESETQKCIIIDEPNNIKWLLSKIYESIDINEDLARSWILTSQSIYPGHLDFYVRLLFLFYNRIFI